MPDDLAAALDSIRADAQSEAAGLGPTRRAAERDVPRLVAALDKVLALADGWTEPDGAFALADGIREAASAVLMPIRSAG